MWIQLQRLVSSFDGKSPGGLPGLFCFFLWVFLKVVLEMWWVRGGFLVVRLWWNVWQRWSVDCGCLVDQKCAMYLKDISILRVRARGAL